MSLLDRIAHSDGNPDRTIIALRLINERLAREMAQYLPSECAIPESKGLGLLARLHASATPDHPAHHFDMPRK